MIVWKADNIETIRSAITWAGFDNFTFLFSYEDTRDAFGIPHDLDILAAVFRVPAALDPESPPESKAALARRPEYNRTNRYWKATSIAEWVERVEDPEERNKFEERVKKLKAGYGQLSDTYQSSKGTAEIPLA